MFFFFSIMPKNKLIYERDGWQIFETYTVFSLFLIPVFRWDRKYYAKRFNEERVYMLDKVDAMAFQQGQEMKIDPIDIDHRCPCCHRELDADYAFCPYCGTKL